MADSHPFLHDPLPPPAAHGLIYDIRLGSFGFHQSQQQNFKGTARTHAVVIVLSGHGYYQLNDDPQQVVGPGSCFTVWPGAHFSFGPDPDSTWNECFLCMHGAGLQRWVDLGLLPNDGKVRILANPRQARTKLRRITRMLERQKPFHLDRSVAATELWLVDLHYDRSKPDRGHKNGVDIEPVLHFMRVKCHEPIDLEALAVKFDLSYSSLRQTCRAATGLPPHKYLIALRCARAQHLLADASLSISTIAEHVGYEDPYTFSRIFKRTTGLAPRVWRSTFFPVESGT